VQCCTVAGKMPNWRWVLARRLRLRRSQDAVGGGKPHGGTAGLAGRTGFRSARGAGRDGMRPHPCKSVRWPARCLTQALFSRGGLVCGAPSQACGGPKASWTRWRRGGDRRLPASGSSSPLRPDSGLLHTDALQTVPPAVGQPLLPVASGETKVVPELSAGSGRSRLPRVATSGPCLTPGVSTRLLASHPALGPPQTEPLCEDGASVRQRQESTCRVRAPCRGEGRRPGLPSASRGLAPPGGYAARFHRHSGGPGPAPPRPRPAGPAPHARRVPQSSSPLSVPLPLSPAPSRSRTPVTPPFPVPAPHVIARLVRLCASRL